MKKKEEQRKTGYGAFFPGGETCCRLNSNDANKQDLFMGKLRRRCLVLQLVMQMDYAKMNKIKQ